MNGSMLEWQGRDAGYWEGFENIGVRPLQKSFGTP